MAGSHRTHQYLIATSLPASFQLKSVMSQGVIHDWEALEAILDHALK